MVFIITFTIVLQIYANQCRTRIHIEIGVFGVHHINKCFPEERNNFSCFYVRHMQLRRRRSV